MKVLHRPESDRAFGRRAKEGSGTLAPRAGTAEARARSAGAGSLEKSEALELIEVAEAALVWSELTEMLGDEVLSLRFLDLAARSAEAALANLEEEYL